MMCEEKKEGRGGEMISNDVRGEEGGERRGRRRRRGDDK